MNEHSLNDLKNEDKEKTCPECGSDSVVFENDELFCKKCGFVLE
ncbi:MAG: TFIIB-type zinc ribbon-containing protein [Candidatus Woesearchaeota archaeon]